MASHDGSTVDLYERIRPWRQFREDANHLFPTESAFRWFIRTHEHALLSCGALLKLSRGNYIDPAPFRAAAIGLMRAPSVVASGLTPSVQLERGQASPAAVTEDAR